MDPGDRFERVAGGLIGLLVGDALGVPYEFKPAAEIPASERIECDPPMDYPRSHAGVPPGTWSDDGAQALCLLESLLERGRLDLDDFAARLVAWFERGHLAVDGHVFDCGLQTAMALRALAAGAAPGRAGPRGEHQNGNGSLMRVLPLALWHAGSDAELFADAALQSTVTHGHLRARLCCGVYCLWARRLMERHRRPWEAALAAARDLLARDPEGLGELEGPILAAAPTPPRGSGYVVDCLHSARAALRDPSYDGTVRAAISLGNDTDTTAAVAGGLAGVRGGLAAIPTRWRRALRGSALVEPLLERLLACRG